MASNPFSWQEDEYAEEKSDGFWKEFFLLRPDRQRFRDLLNKIPPAEVLAFEGRTRELFSRATEAVKSGQVLATIHALDVRHLRIIYGEPPAEFYPDIKCISLVSALQEICAPKFRYYQHIGWAGSYRCRLYGLYQHP